MRLFTRYVLGEVLWMFLLSLGILTAILILVFGGKQALDEGLGPLHFIQLVPYLLPNALLFAVPGTILFAVSHVYSRMAGANEIVAIKAQGISPMVVVWPTLVVAILLSFVTVWINDVAVSWGYQGGQRVVVSAIEDIAYGMLSAKGSYHCRLFSINVTKVDGRRLIKPVFTFQARNGSPATTIRAEEAELRSDPQTGVLTVTFRNGWIESGDVTFHFPDTLTREISLDEATRKGNASRSPAHLSLRVLPEHAAEQRVAIGEREQELAAQAAYQMLTGDLGDLAGPNWTEEQRKLKDLRNDLFKLQTEPPRRWANGFSCLCFTIVGAAMGIRRRNSDAMANFFLCFLPVLVVYYPLLMYGVDRSKAGTVHPYTVWLANAIFLVWGAWMLRKVVRY